MKKHFVICCTILGYALFCVPSFAAVRTWSGAAADSLASTPGNWSGNVAPVANDSIMFDNTSSADCEWDLNISVQDWTQTADFTGTVIFHTRYPGQGDFTEFVINGNCTLNNGTWTHPANAGAEVRRLSVAIYGDMTISAAASIDLFGKGYQDARKGYTGPGGRHPSASHGGTGLGANPSVGGVASYGSITEPVNLGSGGSWAGNFGGGAMCLRVGGTVQHDGLICATASDANSYYMGSGGSIFIIAGALAGGGTIRADGGTASGHSPGGGGRISLVVTNAGADFTGFTGPVHAFTGGGGGNSGVHAGTIYLKTPNDPPGRGELIINNQGGGTAYYACADLNDMETVTYDFRSITLTNNATLRIGPGDTLVLTNTALHGSADSKIDISGGTLIVPGNFTCSNVIIRVGATNSIISPASSPSSLTLQTNAVFILDQPHSITTDIVVAQGGLIAHTPNVSAELYKIDLALAGNLTVQEGGAIDVTGKGYDIKKGPGYIISDTAASHGGRGAPEGANPSGPCYGSITAPTNMGSGGARSRGGGAIIMNVSGIIHNEGHIFANGSANYDTGAGGSIFLTAGELTGNAAIQANGGDSTLRRHGGGGRIALIVTNNGAAFSGYTGPITAFSGRQGADARDGGAGTIYLQTAEQGTAEGTLIIDNDNMNNTAVTEINVNVTGATAGNVFIRNAAHLLLMTNEILTVSGIWSNSAVFEAQWNSAVIFDGAPGSTSRIYGSTTFMGLISTNETGKTLLFEAAATSTLAPQGRLILRGHESATNLFLHSTAPNSTWRLDVDSLAEQNIWHADVRDSNAGGGAEITAFNSINRGNNNNWRFMNVVSGATNQWTGAENTLWTARENWSLDRAPLESDYLLIPAGCPNYPVFDAPRTVADIEIQTGGSLILNGYDLTVTGNAKIAGKLTANARETITLLADSDFTGATLEPALSTIALAGTTAQTFNPANITFYNIAVLKESGAIHFTAGLYATELRCSAPSGTRSLQFAHGSTITLRDLVLQGTSGSANIFLRSSADSQAWNMTVSGYRHVTGVDVRDSNANGGLPIPTTGSINSGGNFNWTFDSVTAEWNGSVNNNFHTSDNWSTGIVPGPGTRVLMDSVNPMVVTGAVTLLDLTIGGGAAAVSTTVNAPLTVIENINILDNGTLALNRPSVISNNISVLEGGVLTHSPNTSSEINKLEIDVFGTLEIDSGAAVDMNSKGYSGGNGPGTGINGGSHGGRGRTDPPAAPCYGSISAPTNLGSGGRNDRGGGTIIMRVAKNIRTEGVVSANAESASYYGGAGGSIFITAGSLTGIGIFMANGSDISGHSPGGGGRISLVLTNTGAGFSTFTGTIEAYSGRIWPDGSSAGNSGAGTVYMRRAGDDARAGIVIIDNGNLNSSNTTDVPPLSAPANEADWISFFIRNSGALRLTNNYTIGDIWLETENATLDLNLNRLTINSLPHKLGPGTVINYGEIIWLQGALFRFF